MGIPMRAIRRSRIARCIRYNFRIDSVVHAKQIPDNSSDVANSDVSAHEVVKLRILTVRALREFQPPNYDLLHHDARPPAPRPATGGRAAGS